MSELSFDFAYALGKPQASGHIRTLPEDFQVDEQLGFEPSGEGEHLWLQIKKRDTNTEWLGRQLIKWAGVTSRELGYSGLKDKNAVTTQWFSLHLPGKADPDIALLDNENIQVLQAKRHHSKLRRGTHKSNAFQIVIRDVDGDHQEIERRLQIIEQQGAPNYFGEQRFGHQGRNVSNALVLLEQGRRIKDRHKRSLYLSAARSYIFNKILSRRVEQGSWNQILPGEAAMLAGSHSFFVVEKLDEEISRRLAEHDIHPSGPLWGKGALQTCGEVEQLESSVTEGFQTWRPGLEREGLKQMRRPLRVFPEEMQRMWLATEELKLCFVLQSGSFATAILREILSY